MKLDIKKTYDRTVLNISTELENGKIYALVGANGSGKSTLLKILSSQIYPDKDSCIDLDINKKEILYMPQSSYAFDLSVLNNIKLAIPTTISANEKIYYKYIIHNLLKKLNLYELRKKNAKTLSGGERQKMALIRSIFTKKDLLLLDEPTSAMDIKSTLDAEKIIKDYHMQFGCTIIFATHSIKQAERLADEILFLSNGELIEKTNAKTFITSPQTDELKNFLLQI